MTKINIYNDRNESLNQLAEKNIAHKDGLWHRTFICIVLDKQNKSIILQKKVKNKYSFDRPDYLDISVCGHYEENEKIEDGTREIKEEIGLNVGFNDLINLGIRQNSVILSENYYNREFQYIFAYVLKNSFKNTNFNFEDGEVVALYNIKLNDGIELLLKKIKQISVEVLEKKDKKNIYSEKIITLKDFVPDFLKVDNFMLRLFVAGRRVLDNDKELIFW